MNPVARLHVQVPLEILARRDLTATAKLVWAWLRYSESTNPIPASPTIGEIAAAIGASRPTAQKALGDLTAAGLLSVLDKGGGYAKRGKYRTALPTIKKLDSSSADYPQETLPSTSKKREGKCPTYHQGPSQITTTNNHCGDETAKQKQPGARRNSDVCSVQTAAPGGNGNGIDYLDRTRKALTDGDTPPYLLTATGLKQKAAIELARRFPAERVKAVIRAALRQDPPVKNLAGWTRKALEKGWAVK